MKLMTSIICAAACFPLAAGLKTFRIDVDPGTELGPIKDMHAVNNGPTVKKPSADDQMRGNFEEYRALRIPFARTHDSINCVSGGAHTVDVTAVFPDFDADENDPENYDFTFTDAYLDSIRAAGTEVFFRLGQSIEHGPKKYGIRPPKDFAKWARICEHIIRHYNEGWGWENPNSYRNQFKIRYWEIWNEPDLDWPSWMANPRTWAGSAELFDEFFAVAAKHLKGCFPGLKIGGPAVVGSDSSNWAERFLANCRTNAVPLDFFSWHIYTTDPWQAAIKADKMRRLLDRYGFSETESILNEWNYVKGWTDEFPHSVDVICGADNLMGAAFTAATMSACQNSPVDILMYYDARTSSVFNGIFDRVHLSPLKAYYAFYAWSRLKDYGLQVKTAVPADKGLYATAAKTPNGSLAVFVVRYSKNCNSTAPVKARISIAGRKIGGIVRAHLTDGVRSHTEIPLEPEPDGDVAIRLQPQSFALIEF